MTTPETALVRTLEAMRLAIRMSTEVARASSETARSHLAARADETLGDVARHIDGLAKAAADTPTLFGQNVGDGLDAQRSEAKAAIELARTLVAGLDLDVYQTPDGWHLVIVVGPTNTARAMLTISAEVAALLQGLAQ